MRKFLATILLAFPIVAFAQSEVLGILNMPQAKGVIYTNACIIEKVESERGPGDIAGMILGIDETTGEMIFGCWFVSARRFPGDFVVYWDGPIYRWQHYSFDQVSRLKRDD